MPFGVEPRRSSHQQAEVRVVPRELADGPALWVPCRLTVTRDRLACIASRSGGRRASFDLALTDVVAVEVDKPLAPRVVTVRTPSRVVELRMAGAGGFARRLTTSRDAARRRASVP